MTRAALHLDPHSHRLLGVWTSPSKAYYSGASLASQQRGRRVMEDHVGGTWDEWIDRLQGRNPGEISWESAELQGTESAKDVFARLSSPQ